ncbi:MAG: hypothetical protein HC801_11240 [Nitrospira sp.]|nr:hypothetical protein [Nitrospira sp.]
MIRKKILHRGIVLIALLGASSLHASPIDVPGQAHQETAQLVHEANHEVDRAWEAYHRAALGGTVASPALQADIEQHLHEARTLVTQAHEAAEQGDRRQVEHLVKQVRLHTTQAIKGSKEQKR